MTDPAATARIGTVLDGKWTLESLLGVGGMGAVYAARHRNGARAAVKILSPEAGRMPHIRKRFLQEGYAANRVEHPNAVKVLDDDVVESDDTAYLVMELLEGEPLSARAKRPLEEAELLRIADGVLAVLEAAHEHGVVHRDMKPDNIFLADGETETVVKVLDFGLARLLESEEKSFKGIAVGTATYMSPEQAAGHTDEIDGRTDIYALGSILFQLASNKRIHDAAHTLGLVVRMATTPAPKLVTVAPDATPAFAAIVDRALAFRRDDRYPTATAMRADVQAALAGDAPASDRATIAASPAASGRTSRVVASGSRVGAMLLVTILGGSVAAWTFRRPIEPVSVTEPAFLPDAASPVEDAAALQAVALLDAAVVEDAGVDAGDEADEEEDDDEPDAAVLDAASPRRAVPPNRPRKLKTPSKPGQPGPPRRRKRWHW